jgi:LmbE family N-acetylglucosaminyl deacetylase
LIAKYAAAGVRVDLFCATNGDAGKSSGVPVSSREELGLLRRNELISAARFLGVRNMELPGYRDGTLSSMDPELLIRDIVLVLRRWRPEVVITFGPEGAPTGHPDHRAISRAATAAFFLSGLDAEFPEQLRELKLHRAQRLYYAAWRGRKGPRTPQRTSLPAAARIEVASFMREQMGAFLLHATQRQHMASFVDDAYKKSELFAFAAGVPQRREIVDDLFAGL